MTTIDLMAISEKNAQPRAANHNVTAFLEKHLKRVAEQIVQNAEVADAKKLAKLKKKLAKYKRKHGDIAGDVYAQSRIYQNQVKEAQAHSSAVITLGTDPLPVGVTVEAIYQHPLWLAFAKQYENCDVTCKFSYPSMGYCVDYGFEVYIKING